MRGRTVELLSTTCAPLFRRVLCAASFDPVPPKNCPDGAGDRLCVFPFQDKEGDLFVFKTVVWIVGLRVDLCGGLRIVKVNKEPHTVIVRVRDTCSPSAGPR